MVCFLQTCKVRKQCFQPLSTLFNVRVFSRRPIYGFQTFVINCAKAEDVI